MTTKRILALLVSAIFLSGCTVASLQPAALAYEGVPENTVEAVPVTPEQVPTHTPVPAITVNPSSPLPTITPTLVPSPTAIPTRHTYGPYSFPKEINPLTGLPVEDLILLERRPIVIKVTNF